MERFDLLQKNFNALNKEFQIVSQQLKEESNEFFNAIVEHSSNFIFIIQQGKFVYINGAGIHLLKANSSTDIIGKNITETVSPAHQTLITKGLKKASTEIGKSMKLKFQCFNNSFVDCECNLAPFQYNNLPAILIIGRDITEELNQKLKLQTEEKLRIDILNAFEEVIAVYGPDHTFLWLNDAGKKQLNIHDDSYIGKLCYKKWFNAKKPCTTCPVVTRKIESLERIVKFDNNKTWLIKHMPLFDSKGFLWCYIEFRTDITEKQNTKVALEKSHAKQIRAELTNLFGHFEIDLKNNSYDLSPGTLNILGLTNKKNRYNSDSIFFNYVHPNDSKEVLKHLELAYTGEKKFDRIFKILDADCTEKTIRGLGEVKTDPLTGNKKFFSVIQDITRISNLEKLIFDEREKYKMLAENAPFGLILMQNNKPVYINKTLTEWFDIDSVSDFEKKGFANFFHPNDIKATHKLCNKIKDNNIPSPIVENLRFTDSLGNIRSVKLNLVNNAIQEQNFIQIVLTDITDDVIQEKKQKQVAADALYINQKNSILGEIEGMLTKILAHKKYSKTATEFSQIYSIINSYKHLDKDWNMLVANFEEVHPGFFSKLKNAFPKLSTVDIKHCACIKMNMDTKEIARFFNIKVTSVQIARVRIKKKMNVPDDVDLRTFILNF
jgi:PAS domain S-box-containing protein